MLKTEGMRHAHCHCTSPAESESPSWRPGVSLRARGCTDPVWLTRTPRLGVQAEAGSMCGSLCAAGPQGLALPAQQQGAAHTLVGQSQRRGQRSCESIQRRERESCLHRWHPASIQGTASSQPPGEEGRP